MPFSMFTQTIMPQLQCPLTLSHTLIDFMHRWAQALDRYLKNLYNFKFLLFSYAQFSHVQTMVRIMKTKTSPGCSISSSMKLPIYHRKLNESVPIIIPTTTTITATILVIIITIAIISSMDIIWRLIIRIFTIIIHSNRNRVTIKRNQIINDQRRILVLKTILM